MSDGRPFAAPPLFIRTVLLWYFSSSIVRTFSNCYLPWWLNCCCLTFEENIILVDEPCPNVIEPSRQRALSITNAAVSELSSRDSLSCSAETMATMKRVGKVTKLPLTVHFYLNGRLDRMPFQTANQGRTNSNSRPEKGFGSKGAKVARFGADFRS